MLFSILISILHSVQLLQLLNVMYIYTQVYMNSNLFNQQFIYSNWNNTGEDEKGGEGVDIETWD